MIKERGHTCLQEQIKQGLARFVKLNERRVRNVVERKKKPFVFLSANVKKEKRIIAVFCWPPLNVPYSNLPLINYGEIKMGKKKAFTACV